MACADMVVGWYYGSIEYCPSYSSSQLTAPARTNSGTANAFSDVDVPGSKCCALCIPLCAFYPPHINGKGN